MRLFRRFSVRLSLVFLVLLLILSFLLVTIAQGTFEMRQIEVDQRVNRGLAADMLAEIEPYLPRGPQAEEIGEVFHYMMVLNPAIEIYLLDSTGSILAYFVEPGMPLQLERVDLEPIRAFLEGNQELPIYGDDPRDPDEPTHFSVAPVDFPDGASGYLYVVLQSSLYDEAREGIESSLIAQTVRDSLVITVPLVAVLGLVAFFLFSRRLERLARTVRAFGSGLSGPQRAIRARVSSDDEIGELARSFNQMADTIEASVRRIEGADRARREFIANISHDLRNPLATIRGYTETLLQKEGALTSEERRRYLSITLDRAAALSRLIDGLFELSKLEAPDAQPKPERFSLAELVQDVVMHLGHEAEVAGVELVAEKPAELFFVEADVQMIERLLINLIENAINHTPRGGSVRVLLRGCEEGVRCEVADEGPGIPPEKRRRLFERFYIADDSRGAAKRGSGLGLAISKRIVELHAGRIAYEGSEEGSIFAFVLPIGGEISDGTRHS
jgi:signal transduction histidine kinase